MGNHYFCYGKTHYFDWAMFNGKLLNYQDLYWLVVYLPSAKYKFVSWDDEIPNIWKN